MPELQKFTIKRSQDCPDELIRGQEKSWNWLFYLLLIVTKLKILIKEYKLEKLNHFNYF